MIQASRFVRRWSYAPIPGATHQRQTRERIANSRRAHRGTRAFYGATVLAETIPPALACITTLTILSPALRDGVHLIPPPRPNSGTYSGRSINRPASIGGETAPPPIEGELRPTYIYEPAWQTLDVEARRAPVSAFWAGCSPPFDFLPFVSVKNKSIIDSSPYG